MSFNVLTENGRFTQNLCIHSHIRTSRQKPVFLHLPAIMNGKLWKCCWIVYSCINAFNFLVCHYKFVLSEWKRLKWIHSRCLCFTTLSNTRCRWFDMFASVALFSILFFALLRRFSHFRIAFEAQPLWCSALWFEMCAVNISWAPISFSNCLCACNIKSCVCMYVVECENCSTNECKLWIFDGDARFLWPQIKG